MDNFDILLEKTENKIIREAERLGSTIPYIPENGRYVDMAARDISWWTNGFWPGLLWLVYSDRQNECVRKTAESVEEELDRALALFTGLHHDVGFMWRHSAASDYDLTGNRRSLERAMHASTILAGRFNPGAGVIESWNKGYDGYVIIDSLMNLPLLYWMSDLTSRPGFREIASIHASTLLRTHLRDDGHVVHIAVLDEKGNVASVPPGQGAAEESAWSRGQSWGLYGFALSYRHTGEKKFLEASVRIADYYISQVKKTGYIPRTDFTVDEGAVDTTSAVCAVCGLIELGEHLGSEKATFYKDNASLILSAVIEKWADFDPLTDGILSGGTVSYNAPRKEEKIIYGDYFLLEALLRITGRYRYRMW